MGQSRLALIEAGGVDLRASTLMQLARALDLELVLAPRTALPAVQALIGKRPRAQEAGHNSARRTPIRVLRRIQQHIVVLEPAFPSSQELAQANSDMHAKNWSLTYPDGRRPRLSPAYDFLSTTAYIPDETSALKFSRSRYYRDLTLDELAHMANRANLPEKLVLNAAQDMVQRFREAWSQERNNLPMSPDVIQAVERQLSLVPLAGR